MDWLVKQELLLLNNTKTGEILFFSFVLYYNVAKDGDRMKERVLEIMQETGRPMGAVEIARRLGVEKKKVDNAMKELKKEETIISPVRCKWEPK